MKSNKRLRKEKEADTTDSSTTSSNATTLKCSNEVMRLSNELQQKNLELAMNKGFIQDLSFHYNHQSFQLQLAHNEIIRLRQEVQRLSEMQQMVPHNPSQDDARLITAIYPAQVYPAPVYPNPIFTEQPVPVLPTTFSDPAPVPSPVIPEAPLPPQWPMRVDTPLPKCTHPLNHRMLFIPTIGQQSSVMEQHEVQHNIGRRVVTHNRPERHTPPPPGPGFIGMQEH